MRVPYEIYALGFCNVIGSTVYLTQCCNVMGSVSVPASAAIAGDGGLCLLGAKPVLQV